jgi:DNA (cytosine-5)-methyltransferase 1
MAAYYNEFDPKAAAWLRELIKQGHIADGVVDERSIEDVTPNELAGFTQCHFFAGIGVWSYALRRAGWSDDRPIWTGSCPCQPFSAAGKGAGFADERHLWPAFHHLIGQCRPDIVLGEQVASKDGLAWLDLVCADLEAAGYASGAVDFCAAGIGAPHIRQRLWWVGLADTDHQGSQGYGKPRRLDVPQEWSDTKRHSATGGLDGGLADADCEQRSQFGGRVTGNGAERSRAHELGQQSCGGGVCGNGLADASGIGRGTGGIWDNSGNDGNQLDADVKDGRPSPTNGFWRDADWLFCRDGKWRPVEPGTSPLAHGSAARVGRLRGYGNAIVAPAAQVFIEAVMESL